MKKTIAVLLAVLMVFTVMTVSVYASDPAAGSEEISIVVTEKEDDTTRNIQNDEGLVVPVNETQLKFSFMFKIVEKVVKFVLGIFGSDVDFAIADGIDKVGTWFDEVISNISAGLDI